jgi:hypothetical protein
MVRLDNEVAIYNYCVRIACHGPEHGWRIGWCESDVSFSGGLASGASIQVSIKLNRTIEMMKANDMLLRAVLWNNLRALP